ncbi:uncharacterized protein N7496_005994 [Penicillium cataractarum]|uniref:67 kDa myosin-cross-reactive antigen family protein n=1 Tax=Penicillium cataractarum TaxID=2100454 RepID=A0A9W9S1D4_9EURO|nr:uncharacterized protein N7496_005994 [Penicillium cataractarum]KAJ5369902.1 hypothetical protein N7496_005994 [Penicillium cataractarum]
MLKLGQSHRDPKHMQAWLIGGGIASISVAVHLISEAQVPGSSIHLLDLHPAPGGGMTPGGNAQDGYFLPFECHPYFHGSSLERLLSFVPSKTEVGGTMMDEIRRFENIERPQPQKTALVRALKHGPSGLELVETKSLHIGARNRLALVNLILEGEATIGSKTVKDIMDEAFFKSTFWMLWATEFGLQPWHSAIEFRRHLRKYLEDIQDLNNVKKLNRTESNLYESIVYPILTYLKEEHVHFHFNTEVTNLTVYPVEDPAMVTSLEFLQDGLEHTVNINPTDIVIATLGSTSAGASLGTNQSSPPNLSLNCENEVARDWRLWLRLAQHSPKFGCPNNFLSQGLRSTVETFTTTFHGPDFMVLYEKLTHDRPGTGAIITLAESNWAISLSIPRQPVFSSQSRSTNIISGYALKPASEGRFVRKPMYKCSGQEILFEILSFLEFPIQPLLSTSKTIPYGMPFGTAPFLSRHEGDRPRVIPQGTTNIACVGQFVDIPDDTTLAMQYSVHSAQIAVTELMGLPPTPDEVKKSLLLEVLHFMI